MGKFGIIVLLHSRSISERKRLRTCRGIRLRDIMYRMEEVFKKAWLCLLYMSGNITSCLTRQAFIVLNSRSTLSEAAMPSRAIFPPFSKNHSPQFLPVFIPSIARTISSPSPSANTLSLPALSPTPQSKRQILVLACTHKGQDNSLAAAINSTTS